MKKLFECCGHSKKTEEESLECENTHTITRPNIWWLIPFVGCVLLLRAILRKNGIVIFHDELPPRSVFGLALKDFPLSIFRLFVAISPIFLLLGYLLYESSRVPN